MICTRKELAELLNTSTNSIRMMEKRKTLDSKLNTIGFKLVSISKEDKILYNIKKTNINPFKVLRINKKNNFLKYFDVRTNEGANNVKDIAIKSNVNKNTVVTWDKKMLNNKIMSKDGFYYFKIDSETKETFPISKEEYKSYWRNVNVIKSLKNLQNKYLKGLITLDELSLASASIGGCYAVVKNCNCFKIPKYKIDKENTLYLDLNKLLEGERSLG